MKKIHSTDTIGVLKQIPRHQGMPVFPLNSTDTIGVLKQNF